MRKKRVGSRHLRSLESAGTRFMTRSLFVKVKLLGVPLDFVLVLSTLLYCSGSLRHFIWEVCKKPLIKVLWKEHHVSQKARMKYEVHLLTDHTW